MTPSSGSRSLPDKAEQGGLAGTVRTDQTNSTVRSDKQVDVPIQFVARETDGQILELDHGQEDEGRIVNSEW